MQNCVKKTSLFPDNVDPLPSTIPSQQPPQPPLSPQLCARRLTCPGLPGGCASSSSACGEANSAPGQGVTLVCQQCVCCRVMSACWLLGSLSAHLYFKEFYGSVENLVGGNDLLLWVRWGKAVLGSRKEVSNLSLNKWWISKECAFLPRVHYLLLCDKQW